MKSLVLITGATGGLGKAFAVECASRGWGLLLSDVSAERLEILAGGLRNAWGVEVVTLTCDLTDSASRKLLFEQVRGQGLRFRMLINVAGLDYEGLFIDRHREEILTIVRLNVEATLDMTHELLKLRDPIVPFRIINVASLAAFYPMPVKATYAASKRFLLDFSLALRDEVKDQGVTVTALCPAGMPTTQECIDAIEAQGLMGQLTTVDTGEVAARTVEAALRGRAVFIPGLLNRFLQAAGSLVSPRVVSVLIGKRWRAAHRNTCSLRMREMDARV